MSVRESVSPLAGTNLATDNGRCANLLGRCSTRVRTWRHWQRRYARGLIVSDAVVAAGVVMLAQGLRFGTVTGEHLPYANVDYLVVSLVVFGAWLAALAANRSRAPQILGHGVEEYRRVWAATLAVFAIIAVISAMFQLDIARGYLALALPLGLVALTVNRLIGRRYVACVRRRGEFLNLVLAVGHVSSVRALVKSLDSRPGEGYRVVGVCVPGDRGLRIPVVQGIPTYPHEGDIARAVLAAGADTVALTSGHLTPDEIRDLSWQLEGLDVDLIVSPGIADVARPRLVVRPAGGVPLIHVDKPQYEGAKRLEKRTFDVCFASIALVVAAPIMLLAALAVKLTSRGPVFYRSERIGMGGEPFQMLKFRSMVVDADTMVAALVEQSDGNGVLFKMKKDPRVTAVGRVLRRYSIDELPQFINVLRREMSVVGPRPPLPGEVDRYDATVRRRMLVRPGITGLWQVSGRSDLSWEDSVRLDLSYVENWSMLGDLVIVAGTVKAVLLGSGAY